MMDDVAEVPKPVQMLQLLAGFQISQALYAVAELGVATALLTGPRTAEDLASSTGANADALTRVVRALAPLGVFRTEGDLIEVTELGATLAEGTRGSVRDMARFWMKTHYGPFGELAHTVRTGETAATRYYGQPFFDWISPQPTLVGLQNHAMAQCRFACS